MKNSIAVSLALAVVLWAFWGNLFPNFNAEKRPSVFLEKFAALSLSPHKVPSLSVMPAELAADQAWGVFQEYLAYAREHDLEGVKSLAHQVSPACQDPARRDECNALMDSVYAFSLEWQREDFRHVYTDERQIVMLTEPPRPDEVKEGQTPLQIALLFTRDITGTPKVLGAKFCMGDIEKATEQCINTDPATRDKDGDGWWDDIEARFYK